MYLINKVRSDNKLKKCNNLLVFIRVHKWDGDFVATFGMNNMMIMEQVLG